ncbi:NAD(P)H-dependent glycerol-3-phosphate dehydrogenase [Bdellovibrionota bacterium FG-2]
MTQKDFWRSSRIAVMGGGSFGTVLANQVAKNCREVLLYVRDEAQARAINATRSNPKHSSKLVLLENVHALSSLERVFARSEGGVQGVIWCLPSRVCREQARVMAPFFHGDELVIHTTKGIEEGTLKRISEVLREELPIARIGVLSGPNLSDEIAQGDPAATMIASPFSEVVEAGVALFASQRFRVYGATDIVGVEWAGTLKNILAIASGALDALQLGWNARAMLITRGLAEMVRFGLAMGGEESTFLGLAGVGDLLATCMSPLSRNYRVGHRLAMGEKLESILIDLMGTAEGVWTTASVREFAAQRKIYMPITEGVYQLVSQGKSSTEIMTSILGRPPTDAAI